MGLAKGWAKFSQRISQNTEQADCKSTSSSRDGISVAVIHSSRQDPMTVSRQAQTEQRNHQQQLFKGHVPQELSHLGSVL